MNFTDVKKTRAVVDLDAIAHNYSLLKEKAKGARAAAVVKANAYGHGAVAVAKRLCQEGCDFFAVACIDEALCLRENKILGTVLILGYVLDCYLEKAIENDISLAVDSLEHLKHIVKEAKGRQVKIHIKLDTGMNRTGFDTRLGKLSDELWEVCKIIRNNKNVILEGAFSHLAVADEGNYEFSSKQYDSFIRTLKLMEKQGVKPHIRHICNSAGIVRYSEEMALDAVRCGINMYGYQAPDNSYKPCMEFITTVVNVHEVKKGEGIGYGLEYKAEKDMKIAVIGAGYADGLKRCMAKGGGYVLINGKKAPFVGRICMDMAMVDVSGISEVKVGDDAVIFGFCKGEYLSVDKVAEFACTIPYEITCSISPRVPRIYK